MKLVIPKGTTSKRIAIFVMDSSSTTGAGLAALAFNTASLTWYYWREDEGNANATSVTLATATRGTFTSGGFKEKDATNMPGFYELGIPDAALATGAEWVVMRLGGATNMAPLTIEIQLSDPVRGLGAPTALPNTACTTNASLLTSGTGTAQLSVSSGQVILQTGTGTGQLDFTSGVVKSNPVQILGTAISTPATAGILDVNLKNIANATVSTSTAQIGVNVVNNAGAAITSAAGIQEVKVASIAANAITATSIAADAITDAKVASDVTIASVTGSVGSVTGAVGSVTGAVGSVTGNVGGNVVGSVASVTGNVSGNVTGSVGSVAAGGIAAASFAAGAINAAAIATDAIDADALATDAVTEIQSGLSTLTAAGVRSAVGLAAANLDTQLAAIPTATQNSDALLKRDMSAVTGESARSPLNALRFLRNKWSVAAGTLTVTKEDDTTSAWTSAVTGTTGADPITASDPA